MELHHDDDINDAGGVPVLGLEFGLNTIFASTLIARAIALTKSDRVRGGLLEMI